MASPRGLRLLHRHHLAHHGRLRAGISLAHASRAFAAAASASRKASNKSSLGGAPPLEHLAILFDGDNVPPRMTGAILDEIELEAMVRYADAFLDATDVKTMNVAYNQLKTITKRFGMAPLDRQRLRECGEVVKQSEIEKFLSRGMGVVDDTA